MKKGIDNKKVDLSEPEYKHYQELIKAYGAENFNDLFEADKDGIITVIKPIKSVPWAVLFFIQNVMINQQLRSNDDRISALEKQLEKK